jgi:hypothetical protein
MAPSVLIATVVAAVYLAWEPASADLAAQTFRADLFADQGFVLWSNAWYGGFHVPGYSLLYPPLAAWLGVRLVGAIAAVVAAVLFAVLVSRRSGTRGGQLASMVFAVGVSAWLFTGRMPFLLGIAIGLGALLAAESRRLVLCAMLAGLTGIASPVAGLFTGLAGAAIGLAGDRTRGAALALPSALAILVMGLAFPNGGEEPFALSSFIAVPLFAAGAFWLIPPEERELRIGVALYLILAILVVAIPNPLGGNLTRLGALFAAPIALLVAWYRPVALAIVAVPLLYWQLSPPIRDTVTALGDPSTEASFYEPLISRLEAEETEAAATGETRVHVPATRNRWEAVYVAEHFPLARGWMRQLESDDFELFQDGELTPGAYRDWLNEHGVGLVAVPLGVERDYLAEDEVDLIDAGLPFLEPEWSNHDWRVYRFIDEPPVRYRWTPYWDVVDGEGCVERDGDWTRVEAPDGSEVQIGVRFSLDGLTGTERVCSG